MWADLEAAWTAFATAIAPVPATTGYVVAAVIAVWVAAFLADSFAFRALAAVEAIVPSGILFVFGAALGADRLRLFVTAVWLAAAGAAYALHRSMAQDGAGWLAGIRRGTVGSVLRTSALIGAGAIVLALIVGPALAGRRRQGPARHPHRRLGHAPDGQPARRHPGPHRRPAATPRRSRSSPTARATGASPPSTSSTAASGRPSGGTATPRATSGAACPSSTRTPLTQDITITNLDAIWLPAAYAPVRIDSPEPRPLRRRDRQPRDPPQRGGAGHPLSRRLDACRRSTRPPSSSPPRRRPSNIAKHYLALPGNYPGNLRQLAADITKNATTPYEKAIALQDYFQTFTYDLSIPPGSSTNAIERFIEARRGYCEQFAGHVRRLRPLARAARSGGRRVHARRAARGRRLPRARQALPRLARGLLHRHRLGALRADPEPWPARAPRATRASRRPRRVSRPPRRPPRCRRRPPCPAARTPARVADPDADAGALPTLGGLGHDPAPAARRRPGCSCWRRSSVACLVLAVAWLLLAPRLARARWDRRRRAAKTGPSGCW